MTLLLGTRSNLCDPKICESETVYLALNCKLWHNNVLPMSPHKKVLSCEVVAGQIYILSLLLRRYNLMQRNIWFWFTPLSLPLKAHPLIAVEWEMSIQWPGHTSVYKSV